MVVTACSSSHDGGEGRGPVRPNFLVIVADDLGYSDLGAFGGEIRTPNLDALAQEGLQLTNFHTATNCSLTRAMMMTGADNHLVGLGNMAERMRLAAPHLMEYRGYEGYLNFRAAVLPELLRDSGYRTYMSGKWHLGLEEHTSPRARGFERSFSMLEGAAGHLDDRQMMPGMERDHALYREDGELTDIPEDFYSSRDFARKLIGYLQMHDREKPFFAYLAFMAPHWPLQAPESTRDKYAGEYDEGYDVFFDRRLARQKEIGLIDERVPGQPPVKGARPWESLSPDEQRYSARLMEIYAAMVDDMDVYIGEVLDVLRETGQYDNTVILFMSDNGAEGGEANRARVIEEYINQNFDNSYANMGNATSYLMYGREWGRVSSVPSKLFKSNTTQGGILSPAILRYPGVANSDEPYPEFLSVLDVVPTFLELAGIEHPGSSTGLLALQGNSFASLVGGNRQPIHGDDYVMGWEMTNHRAIRIGNWKLVMSQAPYGDGKWKLHNLENDPSESMDLSATYPELVEELQGHWQDYVDRNGVVVLQH